MIERYLLKYFIVIVFLIGGSIERIEAIQATLEHSFDGVSFTHAAVLDIPEDPLAKPNASLSDPQAYSYSVTNDYARLSDKDQSQRYFVKIGSVVASIPAHCWIHAGSKARLTLHTVEKIKAGQFHIAGATLQAPCKHAVNEIEGGSVELKVAHIVQSLAAPKVSTAAVDQQTVQQQQQQQQQKQHVGADDGKSAKPTVKDERTWLQKNWLPLAMVGFIVMNRLNQAANPQEGGTAPPPGGRALPAGSARPARP